MLTRLVLTGLAVVTATLAFPMMAAAQWNNQPYQFRSNIGGGAGISTAYRQAIIDQELNGRRPENLVKGPDGSLLRVIERDQQAFLAESEPDFVVRQRRSIGGAGVSLSTGGVGLGAATIGGWTAMVDGGPTTDYAGARPSASPIDAWVGMLD